MEKLVEIARDPLWQLVGVLTGVIAIFLTYWIYTRQRDRKKLTFQRMPTIPLLTVREEISANLVITFNGAPVTAIYMTTIRLKNSGTTPIHPDDFIEPLRFVSSKEETLLTVDVIESNPSNLDPQISRLNGQAILTPLLLNPGDSLLVKFLTIDGATSSLHPEARIVGVKTIESELDPGKRYDRKSLMAACLAFGGLIVGFVFQDPALGLKVTLGESIGYLFGALGFSFYLYFQWRKEQLKK